ncbi:MULTISPECIES: ethylbenzene dehydrogenase-related protein [Halorussus]|uniref:ethylbenzene dehydrogenase-related protein n=1 Tax=Halorussus TaxID=1070314 RepID=UPI000E2113E8|nr:MULTISPECIES: ethylbenzene dehydrogenase-related protein [Halorussus]NHN61594.1 DMSO reductase [Halorussus sp. JP-T4]
MEDELAATARRLLLAGALVLAATFVPMYASGAPAGQIPVMAASQDQVRSLMTPTAPAWNDASTATVTLSSAPSQVPNANQTSVERANVEAAHTRERLFVRVSWADATKDGNVTPSQYDAPRIGSYGDAVAVQFPANVSQQPGIAMGSPQSMVNVWWWNGAMGRQELLAAGPGTTTPFNRTAIATNASYRDGRWYVVFSRNLTAEQQNRASIGLEQDVPVSFAVWNGSNTERAGRKAVSEWQTLPFGPGPQGPPYQTVLWAIAGLAIAVVVGVTAVAVTRGGS